MKKTLITILRWIAVLPMSIIGSLLANLIGTIYTWINSGGYSWYTGNNHTGVVEIVLFAVQNILTGATFVAAGWYVSPKHKNTVKTILATLVTIICITSVVLAIITNTAEWHLYLSAVTTAGGAIYTATKLNDDILY